MKTCPSCDSGFTKDEETSINVEIIGRVCDCGNCIKYFFAGELYALGFKIDGINFYYNLENDLLSWRRVSGVELRVDTLRIKLDIDNKNILNKLKTIVVF
jgi:hypothetical protein